MKGKKVYIVLYQDGRVESVWSTKKKALDRMEHLWKWQEYPADLSVKEVK